MSFWYNVSTHQVETDENRGPSGDLLGPFQTRQQAERAVDTAHARVEKSDRDDAAYDQRD